MSEARIRIGILSFQGAIQDHFSRLEGMGVDIELVSDAEQLSLIDGLILPGGESTVMGRFLRLYGMGKPIQRCAASGMPIWGICAGAILLASRIDGKARINDTSENYSLSLLNLYAERNSYGKQSSSREMRVFAPGFVSESGELMPFIRAPRLSLPDKADIEPFAMLENGMPVGFIGGDRIMVTAFHPELSKNKEFHRWLVKKAKEYRSETHQRKPQSLTAGEYTE